MDKYLITMTYDASITLSVEANDEGEALTKARELAEESDPKMFSIFGERSAVIESKEEA